MPDDQFIFSSSWLPSPRFELQTLAGYNADARAILGAMMRIKIVTPKQ